LYTRARAMTKDPGQRQRIAGILEGLK
jgi:hypothetical protein